MEVALRIVHGVFIRSVMTVTSWSSNASNNRNNSSACSLKTSPLTDHAWSDWIHFLSSLTSCRNWITVFTERFVALVAVVDVSIVDLLLTVFALYSIDANITARIKANLATAAAVLLDDF
jgi:hypothetical protein